MSKLYENLVLEDLDRTKKFESKFGLSSKYIDYYDNDCMLYYKENI